MGDSFIFDDDETRQSSFSDMPEGDMPEGGEEGAPGDNNNRTFLIAAGIIGGVILLILVCFAAYAFFLLPRQNAGQAIQQTAVLLTNTAIAGGATSTAQALMATPTLDPGSIAATAQAVAAARQLEATRTAEALALLASPTAVVVQATATLVVVETPTPDPVTETVAALYTQAALAELTAATTPVFAKIKATSGNNIMVYIDPNGATLGSLTNGVQVEVLSEQQDINGTTWVKIRFTNAQGQTVEGWVDQSQLITVTPIAGGVPTTGFADEVGLPGLFILGIVLVVIILLSRRLRSTPESR